MFFQRFAGALKAVYDRIIAGAVLLGLLGSLVYLAVRVGMIRGMDRDFERTLENMRPVHPEAQPVDTRPLEKALESIQTPPQIGTSVWTTAMFVPESRVACYDCRRPIPFDVSTCPFCNAPVKKAPKELPPTLDTDGDGLPDVWERKYGLNPRDPSDAGRDSDGDKFSNLVEFRFGTDPADPASYPPPEAMLVVVKLVPDLFNLKFKSVLKLPDGSLKFAINTRGDTRTYFAKLGDEVEGFKLDRYGPKTDTANATLFLRRGEKLIPLEQGQDVPHTEYTAHLRFEPDGSEYAVKIGQTFEVLTRKYKAISIDTAREKVVVEREPDRKAFEVWKTPAQGKRNDERAAEASAADAEGEHPQ